MRETTLPSGKTAVFKHGKGRDLLNAQRKAKSSDEVVFALIAEIAEIDGEALIYEDLLEMDLEDVLALQADISGKPQSLPQNVSSTLPKPQAGATAK
ncbi:MAG: hypothetical protein WCG23_09425 [bacterium]